jgi:hypothetical protein
VSATTAAGFEVRELHQGTSNISFDYRIVAKRRGYESARHEDVTGQIAKLNAHQAEMPARHAGQAVGFLSPATPEIAAGIAHRKPGPHIRPAFAKLATALFTYNGTEVQSS